MIHRDTRFSNTINSPTQEPYSPQRYIDKIYRLFFKNRGLHWAPIQSSRGKKCKGLYKISELGYKSEI